MSVQVKTPTKPQFQRLEIQCGEKSFSSPEILRRSKDDLSLRNESRFSQPWNRKRRFSQSYHKEEGAVRRKRIKSAQFAGKGKPLPSRFLNGGTIDDPLNLNGLDTSELGKQLNAVTPQSSPVPTPVRRQSVVVRVPVNLSDPLNLNDSDEDADLEKLFKRKKQRHNRHKKKDDGGGPILTSPLKAVVKGKSKLEALKIDIDPDTHDVVTSTPKETQTSKPRVVCDKIVSPVIRQVSPKSKKRRRTRSDPSKPEPSASTSRSLLNHSCAPKSEKRVSPKKPKTKKQASQKSSANSSMQNSRSKFVYGNYNRYYGYRNPSLECDKRIDSFEAEWFEGKCVLDIGCNVGHLTLSIARDFHPSKIVGIDIDHKLISAARKNIRYYISSTVADVSKYPISNVLNYGPIEAPLVSHKDQTAFPHNVLFMQGNYVLECDELLDLQKEEYHVILALSVTKWIHFNWGDDGLKRFFRRIYRQLKPGGRLILEPQPWSSYKKKKKLTDAIFQTFQSIKLRPDQFTDYLLSKDVGFSTCTTLIVPLNSSKGFRRPLLMFTKSDTVQNSPYPDIGNATPVRSFHPSVFVHHPDVISEESSCSVDANIAARPESVARDGGVEGATNIAAAGPESVPADVPMESNDATGNDLTALEEIGEENVFEDDAGDNVEMVLSSHDNLCSDDSDMLTKSVRDGIEDKDIKCGGVAVESETVDKKVFSEKGDSSMCAERGDSSVFSERGDGSVFADMLTGSVVSGRDSVESTCTKGETGSDGEGDDVAGVMTGDTEMISLEEKRENDSS